MPMGRSGQSSDAQRTILIGSLSPKVRCLRATASQRRIEMSESVIFSQPGLARFFPHSHWAIDAAAHVCESAVKVENSPPHNSQQQLHEVRKQQHQFWWVHSAISVPSKMTVIAAGVERRVPEWRSGPLPEVGGFSLPPKCRSISSRDSRDGRGMTDPTVKQEPRRDSES